MNKYLGALAFVLIMFYAVGPAMASEDDELEEMEKYLDGENRENRNTEGVKVVPAKVSAKKVSANDDKKIDPEDIYSDDKVLGQEIKSEGEYKDLFNVKKWVALIFANDYISAIAALVFAVMGLLIILGSSLSILKNGVSAGIAMLSSDGDADEKIDTIRDTERSTIAVIRGLGVTFLALSLLCTMISFLS